MRKLALVCAMLLSSCVVPGTSQAAFVSTLTGNSPFNGGGRIGFANFAVYQNAGNWVTDLGLTGLVAQAGPGSGPAITGAERNVFFFQLARTDANLVATSNLTAQFGFDSWISGGFLNDTIFTDGGGNVIGANSLDAAAVPGFATLAPGAVENPNLITVNNFGGGGDFSFNPITFGAGDSSSVVFFTANSNPLNPVAPGPLFDALAFRPGATTGGATFLLPVANPEPGSLALLSIAAVGGAAMRRRRKKKALSSATGSPVCC